MIMIEVRGLCFHVSAEIRGGMMMMMKRGHVGPFPWGNAAALEFGIFAG